MSTLEGMRVLTFAPCRVCDKPRPHQQGVIKGLIETGDAYLVHLFDWVVGFPSHFVLMTPEQLLNCRLDDDHDLPWTFDGYDRLSAAHKRCDVAS